VSGVTDETRVTDTPRTFLRKVSRGDESEFIALMRESQQLHEPWISPPTNAVLFKYYMQRVAQDDHEGFAICRHTDERIVGVINVNNIVRGSFQSGSLGYYVGAEFHGKGYMQEGLEQLITYTFRTMGLHRLEANIQPDNVRSQQLVARCGFIKEGYSKDFLYINGAWRDHERWCRVDRRSGLRSKAIASDDPAQRTT
jgi:ribosomal-protein-alanine N-acetyltransferase